MSIVFTVLALGPEKLGQVKIGCRAVSSANSTSLEGQKRFVAITDPMGVYSFPELPDGSWMVQVEMSGFATLQGDATTTSWELRMLPMEEIHAEVVHAATPAAEAATANTKQAAAQPKAQTG